MDSYSPAMSAVDTKTLEAPRRSIRIAVAAAVVGVLIPMVAQCALLYLFVRAQPDRPAPEPVVPWPIEATASATINPSPAASESAASPSASRGG